MNSGDIPSATFLSLDSPCHILNTQTEIIWPTMTKGYKSFLQSLSDQLNSENKVQNSSELEVNDASDKYSLVTRGSGSSNGLFFIDSDNLCSSKPADILGIPTTAEFTSTLCLKITTNDLENQQKEALCLDSFIADNINELDTFQNFIGIKEGFQEQTFTVKDKTVLDAPVELPAHRQNESDNSGIRDRLRKRDALVPKIQRKRNSAKYIMCDRCKVVFQNVSEYYFHRSIHMPIGKSAWLCAQCSNEYDTEDNLRSHELQAHGEVRPFPCPYCATSFPKKFPLDNHIRSRHHNEKTFKCTFCSYAFSRPYDLKMHLNLHLGIKVYMCHFCGQRFSHPSNMTRHQRIHTRVKPYVCKTCNIRFCHITSLRAHEASHINKVPWSQDPEKDEKVTNLKRRNRNFLDKKISSNINSSDTAKKQSRLYYCCVCGAAYNFKRALKLHEQYEHQGPLHCQSCGKSLSSVEDFRNHSCCNTDDKISENFSNQPVNRMYKDLTRLKADNFTEDISILQVPPSITVENYDDKLAKFITISISENSLPYGLAYDSFKGDSKNCNISHPLSYYQQNTGSVLYVNGDPHSVKSSSEETEVEIPVTDNNNAEVFREVHKSYDNVNEVKTLLTEKCIKVQVEKKEKSYKGDKIFKCLYCTKIFNKKWNFKQHMGTHDISLRLYTCKDCDRSFSYRATYANHLLSHMTHDVKFHCSQCTKNFKTKNGRIQHEDRCHTKKRKYSCSSCNKGFYNKSEYGYHLRIHNKDCPYICCCCGKKFSHSSHLYRHERIHTGEKPHKCQYCSKAFIQAVALRNHQKKHKPVIDDDSTFIIEII